MINDLEPLDDQLIINNHLINKQRPILIDGGLATQLEYQGFELNSKLWSAKILMESPQAISNAHKSYIDAGADIITTAGYQASEQGLFEFGLPTTEIKKVILNAVKLATHARDSTRHQVLVAASIGPYGAYLADGSEYTGDYGIDEAGLIKFHQNRINWLSESSADLIACETIPNMIEASALNRLLQKSGKPAWVSFSCNSDSTICDGFPISDAVKIFNSNSNVLAVGINCTQPQYVSHLIDLIKGSVKNKKIVVYPNSGEIYDAKIKSWGNDTDTYSFLDYCESWIKQGVDMIGGCCRIGPKEISDLRSLIDNRFTSNNK